MKRHDIRRIASLLTEDPDVFQEDMAGSISTPGGGPTPKPGAGEPPPSAPGADKPLNSTEIEKQADEVGGTPQAGDVVADQMKMQQEMEQEQAQQRQQIMEPQFQQLNDTMGQLQTGVLQGKQATQTGGDQFGNLEKEMTSLNTLIGNLQKQV